MIRFDYHTNAKVLPEPVFAKPKISLPDNAIGIV
jgi:hypothetical protein